MRQTRAHARQRGKRNRAQESDRTALPGDEPVRAIRRREALSITVVTAKSAMHATETRQFYKIKA